MEINGRALLGGICRSLSEFENILYRSFGQNCVSMSRSESHPESYIILYKAHWDCSQDLLNIRELYAHSNKFTRLFDFSYKYSIQVCQSFWP